MNLRETVIAEFFFQSLDEFGADVVLFVIFLILVALFNAGVTADRGDVDHAVSTITVVSMLCRDEWIPLSLSLVDHSSFS